MEWNNLGVDIRNSAYVFNKIILKLIRPEINQVFRVDISEGLKFLPEDLHSVTYLPINSGTIFKIA